MNLPTADENDDGSCEVTAVEKRELDERWERFERNPSRALALEQFQALIEARRGRIADVA